MDWAGNPDEKRSRCMSLVGRHASRSAPPPTPYSLEANFSIRTFSLAPVSPSWGHVSDFWCDPWPPILKILDQRGLLTILFQNRACFPGNHPGQCSICLRSGHTGACALEVSGFLMCSENIPHWWASSLHSKEFRWIVYEAFIWGVLEAITWSPSSLHRPIQGIHRNNQGSRGKKSAWPEFQLPRT